MFRNFSTLRTRLMLEKQDQLSRLKEQLERLDQDEPFVLFRGSLRRDRNEERRRLLDEIDQLIVGYG